MESRYSLLLTAFLLFAANACAEPVAGTMYFYDTSGFDLCENPGFCGDVTGDYDASAGTLSFDPTFLFGAPLVASSVELLPEGTSELDDGYNGTYTVTVGPGQLGAYMVLTWQNIASPTVMVWDVDTSDPTSPIYTPVDSDGDSVPGHALPPFHPMFPGFTWVFEFWIGEGPPTPPGVDITLDVPEGIFQECTGPDGKTVEISANVDLTGGAVLDSITWFVDGEPAGSGTVITPTLAVSVIAYNITATALTTTGETDTASTPLIVFDLTPPVLDVALLDARSGDPVTQIDRANVVWIKAHFAATDLCDPDPVTSAVGGFEVENNDLLKVQGKKNTVTMTTSELVMKVTSADAPFGNISEASATLMITD